MLVKIYLNDVLYTVIDSLFKDQIISKLEENSEDELFINEVEGDLFVYTLNK